MRYLFGFLCVCALSVVPLPQNASAQAGEAGTTPEPSLQEPAPSSEPAPEEPALQLKLDDADLKVAPSPLQTVDGYTLEEMDLRVRRARIGLISSAAVLVVGGVLLGVAGASANIATGENLGLLWGGSALAGIGLVGTVVAGGMFGHRKRKLRELQEARYETPRRAQWDLARSRLVF